MESRGGEVGRVVRLDVIEKLGKKNGKKFKEEKIVFRQLG